VVVRECGVPCCRRKPLITVATLGNGGFRDRATIRNIPKGSAAKHVVMQGKGEDKANTAPDRNRDALAIVCNSRD